MVEANEIGGLEGLPEKAKCIECGYLLRGLVVARCPECGTGFDPGDARSYQTELKPGVVATVALVVAGLTNLFFVIAGELLILESLVDVAITSSTVNVRGLIRSCLLLLFGLANCLAFGHRDKRPSRLLYQLAIIVDVLVLLVAVSLMVYYGGMVTIVVLVLAVIPAGNIFALLMVKDR